MPSMKTVAPQDLVAGSTHVSDVAPGDNRFFAQVDNTLVALLPYPIPQVQMTFLSIRIRYKTQTIHVISVDDSGLIEGHPPQYNGEAESTDVGSVRLRPEDALALGTALITNARQVVSPEDVAAKLAEAGLKLA